MFKKILILLLLLGFSLQNAFALFGTRPMGMGGAFTAVSDDANAPYWNPAGLALNPEVSITGSTMANNRNIWVGDNVGSLKLSYETEMNPFEWIAGIGAASLLAFQGAQYLSEQGILKKGWGREGEKAAREESMAAKIKGTEEVVSLREEAKEAVKEAAKGAVAGAKRIVKEAVKEVVREAQYYRRYYLTPWASPWYHPNYYRPHYWERREPSPETKAQFALGISWLNDYNARPSVDQNTNWYTLTLASGFEQRVAVGANLNVYYLQKISTDVKGLGAGIDLGAIAKPLENVSFGVVAKEILTTDVKWQTAETSRYEMQLNAGVALQPTYSLTLAADVHNLFRSSQTYHYGAEAALMPGLLARAGLSDGSKTVGMSIAVGNLILDYAYLGGAFNRTQMAGASWRF